MFRLTIVILAAVSCSFGASLQGDLHPGLEGRIVGGNDATIEEYPHQVSLRYIGLHRCGASILDEETILTAAHCVKAVDASGLSIVAGTSFKNEDGQRVYVKKVIMHEKYSGHDYDIAVLKLDGKLVFGPAVQPIKIAEKNTDPQVADFVKITGWGAVTEAGYPAYQLQVVSVPVVDRKRCFDAYKIVSEITDRMFCGGFRNGGRDACKGDSGGPVIMNNVQLGVVSWGFGCGWNKYPGVYTNIGAVREWIDNAWHSN